LTVVETAKEGQNALSKLNQLEQEHLVLVEGTTDQAIVVAIIEQLSLDGFHVHNMFGKDSWVEQIKAICRMRGFRKSVTSLGLVRDADANGHRAFQSCASALTTAGLPTPTNVGEVADGRPAVAIEIVPSIDVAGAVEELCLPSFNPGRLRCVHEYFECLRGTDAEYAVKAQVQVYLAGLARHCKDLSVAARRGELELSHEVFDGLRNFLQGLHSF
jgi:hypothetical protein